MKPQTAKQHRLIGIHRAIKDERYHVGRVEKYTTNNIHLIRAMHEYFNRSNNHMSVSRIANINNLSRSTIYKKLRKYKQYIYFHHFNIDEYIQPFLKGYIGSKNRLLNQIEKQMPKHYHRYFELFVGSGSLLFSLQPKHAIINDNNKDITDAYRIVKKYPKYLIYKIKLYRKNFSKQQFYYIKAQLNHPTRNIKRKIAQLIYYQAITFRGLIKDRHKSTTRYTGNFGYRNIAKNIFPIIKSDGQYLHDNNIKIYNNDYRRVAYLAKAGDFVYLDPPYDDDGDEYYSQNFDKNNQYQLYKICEYLRKHHVKFLETNKDTQFVRDMYQSFNIIPIKEVEQLKRYQKRKRYYGQVIIKNY